MATFQKLKRQLHELEYELLHDLAAVFFVDDHFNYVLVVCVLFNFIVLLVSHFKLANSQILDYSL